MFSDQSFSVADGSAYYELPVDVLANEASAFKRLGYHLMGWTNVANGAVTTTNYNTQNTHLATGIASQQATTAAEAGINTRHAVTGQQYTRVAAFDGTNMDAANNVDGVYNTTMKPRYTMPTGNVTLYAVWRASDVTPYTVERWIISGDGAHLAIDTDATSGKGIVHRSSTDGTLDTSKTTVVYTTHYGITDEVAYADKTTSGVWYHVNDAAAIDAESLLGYEYFD
jgi:hypothetical protein